VEPPTTAQKGPQAWAFTNPCCENLAALEMSQRNDKYTVRKPDG